MATGSGKTLLMGAVIMDLWHRGFKDFLILTPNTILFDKTIENFTPKAIKSIFGDGWYLTHNLVTGNSYRDKTCNYEKDKDISAQNHMHLIKHPIAHQIVVGKDDFLLQMRMDLAIPTAGVVVVR